jgi:hypothetical protein
VHHSFGENSRGEITEAVSGFFRVFHLLRRRQYNGAPGPQSLYFVRETIKRSYAENDPAGWLIESETLHVRQLFQKTRRKVG